MSDELWKEAKRVCADMDTSVNVEIVKFLERLVANHPNDAADD